MVGNLLGRSWLSAKTTEAIIKQIANGRYQSRIEATTEVVGLAMLTTIVAMVLTMTV